MDDADRPTVVLLDLDGVVRHFDPEVVAAAERDAGLEAGVIHRTAFAPGLLTPVITGRWTRARWVDEVARLVGHREATLRWAAQVGRVDDEVLAEVDRLRAAGTTVAVLTNGTDTIDRELDQLGIIDRFDAVFNSAVIGAAKPDPVAFLHVCRVLEVEPAAVFFTDDSPAKLVGAVEVGMVARPWVGLDRFRSDLADLGLA